MTNILEWVEAFSGPLSTEEKERLTWLRAKHYLDEANRLRHRARELGFVTFALLADLEMEKLRRLYE